VRIPYKGFALRTIRTLGVKRSETPAWRSSFWRLQMTEFDQVVERGFVIELPRIRANGRKAIRERAAANYLGCSLSKLQGMRKARQVPAYRVRGTWWYPLDGLNTYFDEQIAKSERED
jgi:hypothetical protein